MNLTRGDIVIAVGPRGFGKPRPAVIIQTEALNPTHSTVLVALVSSEITGEPYRILLDVEPATGLRRPSEVMTDKIFALQREKVASVIGHLPSERQTAVERALAFVMGLNEG